MIKQLLRNTMNKNRFPKEISISYFGIQVPRNKLHRLFLLSKEDYQELEQKACINEEGLIGIFYNVLQAGGGILSFYSEIANTLTNSGYPELGQRYYRRFLDIENNSQTWVFYLCCCLLSSSATNQQLYEVATRFSNSFRYLASNSNYPNEAVVDKKIKIGLLCSFFDSSVMRGGILPQLRLHDRERFEIYCYSDGAIPQDWLDCADYWRETRDLTNQQLFELIQNDEIDILRDLSGPVNESRVELFIKKPAPIQIHGANLACTSGLKAFDYILGCDYLIPKNEEQFYVETIYRDPMFFGASLPDYEHSDIFPPVSPPAFEKNGYITFVYFGSAHKVNAFIVDLWCRILKALPNSRFIFKAQALIHPSINQSFRKLFQLNQIEDVRIEFQNHSPHREMLLEYGRGDIMLDSFPHTGGSTSQEALWQGLPVITLKGNHWAARCGAGRLHAMDLNELIADTPDNYIEIAVNLANDKKRLRNYRTHLRSQMKDSLLMDHKAYINALENAYRVMWKKWCNGGNS